MAFTQDTLSKSSTGYAHLVSGQEWIYSSTTDTLATISADGYFDSVASLFSVGETLNVGDLTFERDLLEVTEINPTAPRVKTKSFVGSGSIPDGAVTTPKIAALAVTNPKIDDGAVSTAKIDDLAVTNSKLGNLSVDARVLQTDAVETDKIKDGEVTKDKIAPGLLGTWRIVSVVNIATGTLASAIYNVPGTLTGDRSFALFSFQIGLLTIEFSEHLGTDQVGVQYSGAPNAADFIQIITQRLIP